jgi:DNA-directed RNA polymerase subunit RPC12/RpoP
MANIAELMLEEVNGQAAKSLKNLTDVLGRVVTDLAERVVDADRRVARNKFTLARAEEKIVAEKGARAAVEKANHLLKEQFHQLKEQFHQSNADALKQMHIKVDGQLHSTMVWKRHSPMVLVTVHPSSGSHVVLLPEHDGKSEGGQPAYQCSVCGAGLKAPAGPEKQGGQPEYQCSVCGAVVTDPAALAKRKRGA